MNGLSGIKGLLGELDGTLFVDDQLIPGAAEAVERLKFSRLRVRFTTNTTTKSLASFHRKLMSLGLPIASTEVFGVIQAAQLHLRRLGSPTCKLVLSEDPGTDFAEFPQSNTRPDYIIICDTGKTWDYLLMNELFKLVMGGARMIALHKGKYWQTGDGLQMDIGALIAGLEYVTGQTATVIGKPSTEYFRLAAESLGLPPEQLAMVGDDIESDVGGAQAVGMTGILVRTGKYREALAAQSAVRPDLVVDSIAELDRLL
jgi:HAD superfamily hydrolase (TIGR01458 family)